MANMKPISLLLLIILGSFIVSYGQGPYDEVVEELKAIQKKLGFLYGRCVQGTPEDKRKVCMQMETICTELEKKIESIPLTENRGNNYNLISIDIKNIEAKIASFRKDKKNLQGCNAIFKCDSEKFCEAYLGADHSKVTGLRGLLHLLIRRLDSYNVEYAVETDQ